MPAIRSGDSNSTIEGAKEAALAVLLRNARGPFIGLPRTAGFGYPEPYTRDLMISALGVLTSGNEELVSSLRTVLQTLAGNQSGRGHIPSLVHAPSDRGASDTTPLFLIGLSLFRNVTGERDFLEDAARRALTWMEHQSPDDSVLVAQQPTSDWRDEQWVLGYGLYVNTLVFIYLNFFGMYDLAAALSKMVHKRDVRESQSGRVDHEGLEVPGKPYYALWAYKSYNSERFDLLGNSLAIISGLASPDRARRIIAWVESNCERLRNNGNLALELPPCLFPYIRPEDSDWLVRYERFNLPGEYHNGGVWPFVCGFYIAALVAAGRQSLAQEKLAHLASLVKSARDPALEYGFNEWFSAQDGLPRGQDWQSWSAAMFLYAAECVDIGSTPFFEEFQGEHPRLR
jgi:glycogen debranching enzyme